MSVPDDAVLGVGVRDEREILEVPEEHPPVGASGGEQELVRMEHDLRDGRRVLAELGEQSPGPKVPHLCKGAGVISLVSHLLPIGAALRKRNAEHEP